MAAWMALLVYRPTHTRLDSPSFCSVPASASLAFPLKERRRKKERLFCLFHSFSGPREDNVTKAGFSCDSATCFHAYPCSRPSAATPSAPRNLISSVNETSLSLEWDEPEDTGGRSDLVYNVVCKKCLRDRSPCTRCDDNVDVAPRRLGLRQRKVVVRNLQAHTRYSFEVQAVNGVSGKRSAPPSFSTVNITTNQAGEKIRHPVHS